MATEKKMKSEELTRLLNDAKTDLITLGDWLRFSSKVLDQACLYYGHGTDNAWDEALQLVVWQAGIPWDKHSHMLSAALTTLEKAELCQALHRRIIDRVPLPYITQQAYFSGLLFDVSRDTLIPRSPFSELIENGFQPWLLNPPQKMLDLCTGSGCIGIACAKLFDSAEVDLSDISDKAIAIAQKNISRHQVEERVTAITSDLFDNLQGNRYDLIVSNPPYVDLNDLASMPAEFHHEPALALGSGHDGLDFTRRLLLEARDYLTDEGILIVEVGNSWNALEDAFPEIAFTWLEFEQGGHGIFLLTADQLNTIDIT